MLAVGNWACVLCVGKATGAMGVAPAVSEPNTDKNGFFFSYMKFNTFLCYYVLKKKMQMATMARLLHGIFQKN